MDMNKRVRIFNLKRRAHGPDKLARLIGLSGHAPIRERGLEWDETKKKRKKGEGGRRGTFGSQFRHERREIQYES